MLEMAERTPWRQKGVGSLGWTVAGSLDRLRSRELQRASHDFGPSSFGSTLGQVVQSCGMHCETPGAGGRERERLNFLA